MELNSVFARRLYLAMLIDRIEKPSLTQLVKTTGWPRRTLQDVIKAMPLFGIELEFVHQGNKSTDGYYQIQSWGPFDQHWLIQHYQDIKDNLDVLPSNRLIMA